MPLPATLRRLSLRDQSLPVQWATLLLGSCACMAAFYLLHVPAPFLLGAMLVAIAVALGEGRLRLHHNVYVGAQGMIGTMVASSFTPAILQVLRQDILLFFMVTLVSILLCSITGWLLAKSRVLPGSTAIWGSSPGGAMVMTLMAERHGGDMQMVAVMQYSRVVVVTTVATAVAHYFVPESIGNAAATWFPPVHVDALLISIAVSLGGAALSQWLRLPGGPMVWPMILASALQMNGIIRIELPLWLMAPTYALMGWMIGLRFSRQTLRDTTRALPAIFGAILALIGLCAALGTALTHWMGIDALTAYLATSPGGLDAVAIISTSSGANVPFVMAFQTARLFAVLVMGPALAQFATRRLFARQ